MQRLWSAEELVEHWSPTPEELALLPGKADGGKLGFAVQLAFYKQHANFPDDEADVAPTVIAHIAGQIGIPSAMLDGYDWTGRTGRRHRQLILDFLAVAPFDRAAETALRAWFAAEALPHEPNSAALEEQIGAWFASSRITRPGTYRLDRFVASARAAHDERAFRMVVERLDAETRHRLDALLSDNGTGAAFSRLQADPGRVGLESLLAEISKLDIVRALKLPLDILRQHHPELIKRFRRRVATEVAWELRRHPEHIRLPLLVFYCVPREAEIVDGLIELLLEITHRITVRAERRVVEELLEEYRQVRGKTGILFRIAEAAVDNPDGIVRDVIFPVADEQTFEALVKEYRASGTPQNRRIHAAIRASYGSYYRRMLPRILAALEFRSNNATHRPLLNAIGAIQRDQGDSRQYFALSDIAVDDVIRPKWRDIVVEDAPDGGKRVNRINYEICVLQTLRDKLRCKEVWVVGAKRYRNPDDDLVCRRMRRPSSTNSRAR